MTIKELMEKVTQEQMEKLKECKTAEEILTRAKEFAISMDEEQAKDLVSQFKASKGELSDSELEQVAGGGMAYIRPGIH